jgi:CheY-like chemotaxis protein
MDNAMLTRALEPFFTTKPHGKGTGLGLPMVRGFAEQSGGAFTLASEYGHGTTASLWIPAMAMAPPETAPQDAAARAAHADAPLVLVVDDEDVVREVIAAELADRGYRVIQAEGGKSAVALFERGEPISMLISDLSMPDMDGITLIREAHRRRSRLPAILLTGYAGDAAVDAVGEAVSGAFALMRKPVTGTQLADRVAMLLEAMAPSP